MSKKKDDRLYYVVEEDIPIPPRMRTNKKGGALPFAEMRVGDSFLVPVNADFSAIRRRMFAFINKIKESNGVKIAFNERKYEDGTHRIWRVQ